MAPWTSYYYFALLPIVAYGAVTCPSDSAPNIKAPHENIWAPLSLKATKDVEAWLYNQKALNLTLFTKAGISDNSVTLIEALMPNKTDALPYINAAPTSSSLPAPPRRFARVILYNGAEKIPVVRELMVGPLPISNVTTYRPLSYIYQNSTVPGVSGNGVFPFNSRFPASIELNELAKFTLSWSTKLAAAMTDLLGGAFTGSPDDKLTYSINGPNSLDGGYRRFWQFFVGNTPGGLFLAPVGFFVNVDLSGPDTSKWRVRRIVYNRQIFASVDEFLAAYKAGTIKRSPKADLDNTKWATRERQGQTRPLEDKEASASIYTDGSRIRADREAGYVEWLGWSFYTGFNRDTGLTLWDIRFKGQRIIYELALQDAIAQYGGNDPIQSTTAYMDRHYGLGWGSNQLLDGYDCPYGAVTLNATFHVDGAYSSSPSGICIFEHDIGFPTSRHSDRTKKWYGTTRGSSLRVRSMAAVYNYDYVFDYIFYVEGTVEVLMAASGYIQSTYWDGLQGDYGTRVDKTTMGNIHTHLIGYKIDIDIAGTANSLQVTDFVSEDVTHPFLDPEDGPTRQLRVERKWRDTESTFNLENNAQTMLTIANKAVKNAWGYPKAYRLTPGYHTVRHSIVGSTRQMHSGKWGEHDVIVVKQKDTEPSSTTTWNQDLSYTPPVDFSKFYTPAENIDQQDLVVYFNLGAHHLPRAEDTPNTLFTDTRTSFLFYPFNYFDDEPSRDIQNAILVAADETGAYKVQEAGVGDDGVQCTLRDTPKAGQNFVQSVLTNTS